MHGNGIRETTTTTGTGNLTVAADTGFVRFSGKYPVGADYLFPYTITDDAGKPLEGGIGYLSAASTLVRSRVLWTYVSSTYADAAPSAVSLAAGTKYVICAASWQHIQGNNVYGSQFAHASGPRRALFNTLATNAANAANAWTNFDRMHYWPILLLEGANCNGFVISGVTQPGSVGLAIGLYSVRGDGRPGARLASSGKVTPTGSTAPQAFTFSGGTIAVPPGVYFLGAMVTATGLVMDREINRPFLLGSERAQGVPTQGYTENISSGWTDAPSSGGAAIGIYDNTGGYADHPCVGLRVA